MDGGGGRRMDTHAGYFTRCHAIDAPLRGRALSPVPRHLHLGPLVPATRCRTVAHQAIGLTWSSSIDLYRGSILSILWAQRRAAGSAFGAAFFGAGLHRRAGDGLPR